MSAEQQWVDRTSLPAQRVQQSVVVGSDPAESIVEVSPDSIRALEEESKKAWLETGLGDSDRVLVSIARQGAFPVATAPQVLSGLCQSVVTVEPRGRLRLLQAMKHFQPTVWVTTPCAALDFLARLYMEFNIDPFELGIERIVLVGEIASQGTHKRLADEFEAVVFDLYCDPVLGVALAARESGKATQLTSDVLTTVSPVDDASAEIATEPVEIGLNFAMVPNLANCTIRTGQLIEPGAPTGIFQRTTGNHILLRGRWLSLPMLGRALKLIDGISYWHLEVDRGDGTLDRATLKVGLNRESLVKNPMWKSRIREAVTSVTPVRIDIECYLLGEDDTPPPARVDDLRGHHCVESRPGSLDA